MHRICTMDRYPRSRTSWSSTIAAEIRTRITRAGSYRAASHRRRSTQSFHFSGRWKARVTRTGHPRTSHGNIQFPRCPWSRLYCRRRVERCGSRVFSGDRKGLAPSPRFSSPTVRACASTRLWRERAHRRSDPSSRNMVTHFFMSFVEVTVFRTTKATHWATCLTARLRLAEMKRKNICRWFC